MLANVKWIRGTRGEEGPRRVSWEATMRLMMLRYVVVQWIKRDAHVVMLGIFWKESRWEGVGEAMHGQRCGTVGDAGNRGRLISRMKSMNEGHVWRKSHAEDKPLHEGVKIVYSEDRNSLRSNLDLVVLLWPLTKYPGPGGLCTVLRAEFDGCGSSFLC